MAVLVALALVALFWIIAAALFYRVLVAALTVVGALPLIGSVVGASSARGTDTFRFALGRLLRWSVSVNRQRGTLTGSIQIDAARRWGALGLLVACVAAVAVPLVAAVLMPVAIVVVGIAAAESRSRAPALEHDTSGRDSIDPALS
jgi:hypothetical protein